MVKSKPEIIWEKWIDPFDSEDEKKALNLADDNFLDTPEQSIQPDDLTDEEYQQLLSDQELLSQVPANKNMKVVVTPVGVIPITEYGKPSSVFNFWTIHSNFSITPRIASTINEAPGIETMDIFTRYRGRVAIGKVFDEHKVKQDVEKQILAALKRKTKWSTHINDTINDTIND